MENEEKDRLREIQDKMNSMDVKKRKSILMAFAAVGIIIIILRLVLSFGGCSRKDKEIEVKGNEPVGIQDISDSEKLQILEYSLERKEKDPKLEEFMQKLVDEDRKKKAEENGEKK